MNCTGQSGATRPAGPVVAAQLPLRGSARPGPGAGAGSGPGPVVVLWWGGVVVKVFVIHDPNHDIKTYQRRLRELRDVLTPTFNCLPFSAAVLTERAGFLIRQYGKYSLYDR